LQHILYKYNTYVYITILKVSEQS